MKLEIKTSDEKQWTEIKRKLTNKGGEVKRGLAEILKKGGDRKCSSGTEFPVQPGRS